MNRYDEIRTESGLHKVVETSGGAHDRGYQYGAKCKRVIKSLVDSHFSFYRRNYGLSKDLILRDATKYTPYIEDYSPEITEEIKGIAEGAEIKHEELVMIIAFIELYYARIMGCTSFSAAGKATADGITYVGQNNDEALDPWLNGECCVLVDVKRNSGPSFLTYTYAGIPAMMGVNSDGIALCLNALASGEHKIGVPILIVAREILQQRCIGDAVGAVIRANRADCLNFLIADENGEIYDVEATPSSFDCLYTDMYMAHSNHFLSRRLDIKRDVIMEALPDTIIRYNRMNRLLSEECGSIELKTLMDLVKDHVNHPKSICRHEIPGARPEETMVTFDSLIFVPAKKELWIARGNPCKNEFNKYQIQSKE